MSARRVLGAIAASAAVVATIVAGSALVASTAARTEPLGLDDVVAERSEIVSIQWRAAAANSTCFVRERWPEADLTVAFDRWVRVEALDEARADCLSEALGREVTVTETQGLLQVGPVPPTEPAWSAPVADIGCGLSLQPWSGLYPFGGPVEREWVRQQLLIGLPACARGFGARIVVPDVEAAVDGAIYPTSVGRAVSPMQSVWPHVRIVGDPSATMRVQRLCPDPGQVLLDLEPPEIVP